MRLKSLFTEHPEAVGGSYFEHMGIALSFAGPLLTADNDCRLGLQQQPQPRSCHRAGCDRVLQGLIAAYGLRTSKRRRSPSPAEAGCASTVARSPSRQA
jgi:hypothetical protein